MNIEIESSFEIEDLGICEEWVYDIEVENNHNFFGNNILIHNSVYYQIEPFVNMFIANNPDKDIDFYVDWADSFEKKVIQPVIEKTIDDFATELNAYSKKSIGAEREVISDACVFSAKKKYFARVRDSEGVRFPADAPYTKVMGLEIARSSTPKWAKKKLKEAIPHILDKDEDSLRNWVSEIKGEFIEANLNDIAQVGGVSRVDYDLQNDKAIPIGSRAALVHNSYVKKLGIENKFTSIQAGDKCKRLFLRTPNPMNSNIIAYISDEFAELVADYVDFDTQFEKGFLSALKIMVESLGYNLDKETNSLDDW